MRQTYVTFDFDKFDSRGLKPVSDQFKKAGATVTDIEATNRTARMSGFATKVAKLYFEDGQTITLRIKSDGSAFQVKLNSKIIPIKHVDDMNKAVEEMARMLDANSTAWKKAQRRKEARAKVNEDDMKARPLPKSKRIEALETEIAQSQDILSELETENQSLTKQYVERQTTISSLKQQLTAAGEASE